MKYVFFFSLLILTFPVYAENLQDSTKTGYHLFNPTPKNQMRGFETDRPDLTESAYTVDAGHFQFETDLLKTERSTVNQNTSIQNSYNVFNLKLGITNSLDIQFITEMFVWSKSNGSRLETSSSFNNVTIRAKQNLYGNDSGNSAMAILSFVNFPSTSGTKITGGLVLPYSLSLTNGWGFGAQIETDLINNQLGGGYHINPLVSATVANQVLQNFSFFIEGLITRESELNTVELFVDTGFVYALSPNIKLDTGIYYGLKDISPKIVFLGFSFRY